MRVPRHERATVACRFRESPVRASVVTRSVPAGNGDMTCDAKILHKSTDESTPMQSPLLYLLDRRDRALFARCVDHSRTRRFWRSGWTLLTHLGGTVCTVTAALLPSLLASGALRDAAVRALAALVLSHVAVQLVKRTVNRPRPSFSEGWAALATVPDRFSFPSGHSTAAMAVAFSYALAFPAFAVPLVGLAMLVGASRVFLGVHYPGDVVIGQLLAIGTALLI